jgi:hypothetical protein
VEIDELISATFGMFLRPANPAPDQPGGGIWTRAVGGPRQDELDGNGNGSSGLRIDWTLLHVKGGADRSDISQVKVGLNYRLVPTAVVAKY